MAIWSMVDSGARTATGNSGALAPLPKGPRTMRAQLNVTAVSGTTPSCTVLIEDSLDGTNWNTVGTFAAKTATGREVINITTPVSPLTRVSWTISGTTPSFTFSVITAWEA